MALLLPNRSAVLRLISTNNAYSQQLMLARAHHQGLTEDFSIKSNDSPERILSKPLKSWQRHTTLS